jgi:hypothetical protein
MQFRGSGAQGLGAGTVLAQALSRKADLITSFGFQRRLLQVSDAKPPPKGRRKLLLPKAVTGPKNVRVPPTTLAPTILPKLPEELANRIRNLSVIASKSARPHGRAREFGVLGLVRRMRRAARELNLGIS